jgi:hypothetical protein
MAIRLTLWDMESLVDVRIRRYFTHDSKCGQMGDCEDIPKRAYDCTGQCWMLCAAVVHRLVVERVSANLSIKIKFFFDFDESTNQNSNLLPFIHILLSGQSEALT